MITLYKVLTGCIALMHTAVALYMLSILFFVFRKSVPAGYLVVQTAIIGIAAGFHFTTGVCPLTFIEKSLRSAAGLFVYDGNFINYYLIRFFNTPVSDQVIVRFIILFVVLLIYMLIVSRLRFKRLARTG